MHSPDLRATVVASAQKHPVSRASIAVALSGGVDSVVLLHLLADLRGELAIEIAAIHVNHGLSPKADDWERQCAERCARAGVRFAARRLNLVPQAGRSVEAEARQARYAALAEAAASLGSTIVALAHHADDQAETVLLQLLRGGPPKGLAAMPAWRGRAGDVAYWRPLLDATREDILACARLHDLRWIDDESNENVRFKRNFLRHQILPELQSGFPGYRTALARSAVRAAEAARLADDLADIDGQNLIDPGRLPLERLRALGPLRAENLLRRMLSRDGHVVPPAERLAEFVRQALSSAADRHPAVALDDDLALRLEHAEVVVTTALPAPTFDVIWTSEREIALAHGMLRFAPVIGGGIRAAAVPATGLQVRPRRGGERCRVAAGRPTRTLKNLMQEGRIPSALRDGWPLVTDGDALVAVPGITVAAEWQAGPGESGWAVSWVPKGRPAPD